MISLFLFFYLFIHQPRLLEEDFKCRRCGRCCYYVIEGIKHKCRYLIKTGSKTFSCRIYRNRLHIKVAESIYCIERKDDKRIFKNCPYNKTT